MALTSCLAFLFVKRPVIIHPMDYQDKLMENQYKTSILIIKIVGFVLISVIWFFGIALSFVLWRNDQKELAIITSLIATLGNAVSLCIGVLIPSPLQGHRQADTRKETPDATGKENDPVFVAPVTAPETSEPAVATVADFAPTEEIPRGQGPDNLDPSYTSEVEAPK